MLCTLLAPPTGIPYLTWAGAVSRPTGIYGVYGNPKRNNMLKKQTVFDPHIAIMCGCWCGSLCGVRVLLGGHFRLTWVGLRRGRCGLSLISLLTVPLIRSLGSCLLRVRVEPGYDGMCRHKTTRRHLARATDPPN